MDQLEAHNLVFCGESQSKQQTTTRLVEAI